MKPKLEPLSLELIQKAITDCNMHSSFQNDAFYMQFLSGNKDMDAALKDIHFIMSASIFKPTALMLRIQMNRSFPITDLDRLLALVNRHNYEHLWPRAVVDIEPDKKVDVLCDFCVDCECGVTVDHVSGWLTDASTGAVALFEKLVLQEKIATVSW